jgi:adenosylcobinamide kinase/adenosylcobinamide-phosphate guanylyltransferase
MLTLILGGARSGKSRLAQKLASAASRVAYIATAKPDHGDPEMAARIGRHRADRPAHWRTVEEPLALGTSVVEAAAGAVVVDCLTVWLSNLFWEFRDAPPHRPEQEARAQLERISAVSASCHIILVSNELGSGTVPEASLTRAFRDAQGLVNQYAAELADEVILTVAGLPLYLKRPS